MWKSRKLVGHESLTVDYIAFFPSHISYELLIWGLSAAVNDMLLTQNRVLRTIYRAFPLDHCNPLFLKMKALNFYCNHTLIYTKPNLHLYRTRYNHTLKEAEQNLTNHKILIKLIHCFNKLDKSA